MTPPRRKGDAATFSARLDPETKDVLQRAAEMRGESMTDFVLGAAYDRAVRTIKDRTLIELSQEDSERFTRALAAPATVQPEILERFVKAHLGSQ